MAPAAYQGSVSPEPEAHCVASLPSFARAAYSVGERCELARMGFLECGTLKTADEGML